MARGTGSCGDPIRLDNDDIDAPTLSLVGAVFAEPAIQHAMPFSIFEEGEGSNSRARKRRFDDVSDDVIDRSVRRRSAAEEAETPLEDRRNSAAEEANPPIEEQADDQAEQEVAFQDYNVGPPSPEYHPLDYHVGPRSPEYHLLDYHVGSPSPEYHPASSDSREYLDHELAVDQPLPIEQVASPDPFADMRMDIDDMAYEEMLALQDSIGHVSTGLTLPDALSRVSEGIYLSDDQELCSFCQEEYKEGDKIGLLSCKHVFHHDCIISWLQEEAKCPMCKQVPEPL